MHLVGNRERPFHDQGEDTKMLREKLPIGQKLTHPGLGHAKLESGALADGAISQWIDVLGCAPPGQLRTIRAGRRPTAGNGGGSTDNIPRIPWTHQVRKHHFFFSHALSKWASTMREIFLLLTWQIKFTPHLLKTTHCNGGPGLELPFPWLIKH